MSQSVLQERICIKILMKHSQVHKYHAMTLVLCQQDVLVIKSKTVTNVDYQFFKSPIDWRINRKVRSRFVRGDKEWVKYYLFRILPREWVHFR